MDRDALHQRILETLRADARVLAAWLTGSFGRGDEDDYSDLDYWIVVADTDVDAVAADWPAAARQITDLVLERRVDFGRTVVLTHVDSEWNRFDLAIGVPDDVPTRTARTHRLLFDRAGLAAQLRPGGKPTPPSPATVDRLVTEFLRVLGLLPVVVGREDYVAAASGAGLLRDLLIDLMAEDVPAEERRGALRLSSQLDAGGYATLRSLPPVAATRESVIAGHVACAEAFLPLARDMSSHAGCRWPEALERAARDHLRRRLGITLAER